MDSLALHGNQKEGLHWIPNYGDGNKKSFLYPSQEYMAIPLIIKESMESHNHLCPRGQSI